MDFSVASLCTAIVVSAVGFVLWYYGKKQRRIPQSLAGIALMVFPYFVGGALAMAGVATGIIVLLWALLRWGY